MAPAARGGPYLAPTSEYAETAKAEAIAEALGDLVGRRLERPTAHSIGKLFQKCLVGRPAWIGDGQTVAVLRKSTGHSENTYRIDVTAPAQSQGTETSAAANPGQKQSPHSPHSPSGDDVSGKEGKAGKAGKAFAPAGTNEFKSEHLRTAGQQVRI